MTLSWGRVVGVKRYRLKSSVSHQLHCYPFTWVHIFSHHVSFGRWWRTLSGTFQKGNLSKTHQDPHEKACRLSQGRDGPRLSHATLLSLRGELTSKSMGSGVVQIGSVRRHNQGALSESMSSCCTVCMLFLCFECFFLWKRFTFPVAILVQRHECISSSQMIPAMPSKAH